MLPALFPLMALIYATNSWTGKLASEPLFASALWGIITIVVFLKLIPWAVNKRVLKYGHESDTDVPDFTRTLNFFQFGIVAWVALLQVFANPSGLVYPAYKAILEQTLPMAFSFLLYYMLNQTSMKEFRKLEMPILDPEQTLQEFLRARLTPLILVTPPVLLWMLIEDISRGGLEIMHELSLMAFAPLFFILLFIVSPRLFNLAWKSEDCESFELKKEIFELAEKTKTPISGVKYWNTFGEPLANAAVVGLSKKFRYVYITKYMVETFSQRQIKAVVAHELGHLKLGHVLTYASYSILIVLLALVYRIVAYLYFPQIDTENFWYSLVESLVFISAFLLAFTALSRFSEHQADVFSAINTQKEDFISAISQIEDCSEKKDLIPEWLMLHPNVNKRIKKIVELNEINNDKLLKHAHNIRYAMFLAIICLTVAAYYIGKPIEKIYALDKAVRAGNAQLAEKLFNSLPEWLKKHPEALKIKDTSSCGCARSCS